MNKTYNWGILATGMISNLFAGDLKLLENAKLTAVASRTLDKAKSFADKYDIPKAYGSYNQLASDPDIDIIYIGTPHNIHYENAKMALMAGKHVLCEKAFTINAAQAEELINIAREKNLFLMEALWTRFQPAMVQLRKLLNDGAIGEIYHVSAELCKKFDYDPQHRLFNLHLAGGALLDLGIYPISFTSMILGLPEKVHGFCFKADTGVDAHDVISFSYKNNKSAQLICSSLVDGLRLGYILGSEGQLLIKGPMYRPEGFIIQQEGKDDRLINADYSGNAYQYEAKAVMDMLDQGRMEHPDMPLDETLGMMKIMDELRRQWNFSYPEEQNADQ